MTDAQIKQIREYILDKQVRVVLEGTHCTGKSTLGRALAERLQVPFTDEIARGVLKQHGCDASYNGCTDIEIAYVQGEIMARHQDALCNSTGGIIDRGPVSVYAYSLAKLAGSTDPAVIDALDTWRRDVGAFSDPGWNQEYFLLRPGIPFINDGVREPGRAKQEMIHLLISGLLGEFGYGAHEFVRADLEARIARVMSVLLFRVTGDAE